MTTYQIRLAVGIVILLILIVVGASIEQGRRATKDLKVERVNSATQANTAAGYDEVVADKIQSDARTDADVATSSNQRRELKSRDPSYREHLDSLLPAPTRRLYRDAAARIAAQYPGPDGADAADKQAD